MASYLRVKQRTEGGVIHRFSTKSMYQEIPTSSGFEASQGAWGSFSPEFLGIEEYVPSDLLVIALPGGTNRQEEPAHTNQQRPSFLSSKQDSEGQPGLNIATTSYRIEGAGWCPAAFSSWQTEPTR